MAHFLTLGDVIAAIPHVDDPDALFKAKTNRALSAAMDLCRPIN
jgi:hypothetical protein